MGALWKGRGGEYRGIAGPGGGRAVADLGCGRGGYTAELARWGWQAAGIDNIPRAIDAANRSGVFGATFTVGTKLAAADLGR